MLGCNHHAGCCLDRPRRLVLNGRLFSPQLLTVFTMQATNINMPGDKNGGARSPRVSVVLIFFNGEAYLVEAIESVISQTFDDWEFLLVDDGSSDASPTIAIDYANRYPGKIVYLEHPGHLNRGAPAARNLGIAHARSEYIAFIDADDVWLPSKLMDQVAILDAHREVGMVCGAVLYWSSWSGGQDRIVPSGHRADCVVAPPESTLQIYPLGRAAGPCPSDIMLRADVVRDIGGFVEQFIGEKMLFEDQAFFSKLFLRSPIYIASKIWLKYRQHEKSCVATLTKAGIYHEVRQYFFNWFEKYLTTVPELDSKVSAALKVALRPYRHPNIDFLLTLPFRGRRYCIRVRDTVARTWGAV